MTKKRLMKILQKNQADIENENWEKVYENIDYDFRGEFSDFLIDNGIDPSALFNDYIPEHAFFKSKLLTFINIDKGISKIGRGSFSRCTSLESINIPYSVTEIADYGFCNCKSLKSITLPNSINQIGFQSFYGCDLLSSIIIPNSVTSIGSYAFEYCPSLMEIKYEGTEDEWNKVKLAQDWNRHCPAKVIFLR